MHNVIIIGAGGNSKVISDIVIKNGDRLLGYLDDNKCGEICEGYSVIGKVNDALRLSDNAEFIISIGDNFIRKKISEKYNLKWYTAIHPSAQIGLSVEIGEGTCVMANAVINSGTKIGKHCIINSSSVVEHDNTIYNYVHISPNVTLCGTVKVDECCHIGAGAVVKNNISIIKNTIIGVGGVVVKDVNTSGKYIGVPVKPI